MRRCSSATSASSTPRTWRGAMLVAFLVAKSAMLAWYRLGQWKPELGEPQDELVYARSPALIGVAVAVYYWRKPDARQYADEVAEELSKVTWPSRKEVTNSTTRGRASRRSSRRSFFALMDRFWKLRHRQDLQRSDVSSEQAGAAAVESAMAKKWYVIQTYSGYENKVKEALLAAHQGARQGGRLRRDPHPDRDRPGDRAATASSASARRPASPATSSSRWR